MAAHTELWSDITKVARSRPIGCSKSCDLGPHLHRASGAEGVTASQLDLPSLMSLSVAGYGRLQLGAADLATLAELLQVGDN